MRCQGSFVFKSITTQDAGSFVNEKGETINYEKKYVITIDDQTDNGIRERKLKFPITNEALANSLKDLEPYTKICLEFEITLYASNAKVLPLYLVEEE